MPYELFKEGGKTCVRNKATGESKGCSKNRKMAVAHMRALYWAEGKKKEVVEESVIQAIEAYTQQYPEETELITKEYAEVVSEDEDGSKTKSYYGDAVEAYPSYYGATSFEELDAIEQANETARELSDLNHSFVMLAGNITGNYGMTDQEKLAALKNITNEYGDRIDQQLTNPGNEDKEGDFDEEESGLETKAKWSTAKKNDLPNSAFLYVEPGCKVKSCRHFPYKNASGAVDLAHLRNAIARIPQSNAPGLTAEKKTALQNRARKMLENSKKEESDQNIVEMIVKGIKDFLRPPQPEPEFMIFKEENGQYGWIARYSNKFRDNDNPSEILSEASHKLFVDKVEKGLAPKPELWFWHVPEWKFGEATWVAYDDSGFTLSGGLIDKDPAKEAFAEWLSEQKDIAVSHGMPPSTIKRDESDPSILLEYETREISPLPSKNAANKLTGFIVLDNKETENTEDDMPIPTKKRQELIDVWHVNPSLLDALEKSNATTAEKAAAQGIESKEKTEATQVTEPVQAAAPAVTETPATTPVVPVPENKDAKTSETSQDNPITREEIAEAFANMFIPIQENMLALTKRIEDMTGVVKELQTEDHEKVAKLASNTPAASLGALLAAKSVIGQKSALVDGREKIAKSGPAENKEVEGPAFTIPFLADMLSKK